jgi:hypothetical protein
LFGRLFESVTLSCTQQEFVRERQWWWIALRSYAELQGFFSIVESQLISSYSCKTETREEKFAKLEIANYDLSNKIVI